MNGYLYLLIWLISFGASIVGAICGIGGGIIIKPVLDAFGVMSVSAISFLSGCTVLAMSCYSVGKNKICCESSIDKKIGTPLAIGGAIGGVAGKSMFQSLSNAFSDKEMVGAVQALCLLAATLITLAYTMKKDVITTYQVKHKGICIIIGLCLGILSSFLGIGGGPVNLVVLYYFFSMDTKTAAANSLYIIFFSQVASLINTMLTKTVPEFSVVLLILIVLGGFLGGISGQSINKKIDGKVVDKLFKSLMVLIILINLYNIYREVD